MNDTPLNKYENPTEHANNYLVDLWILLIMCVFVLSFILLKVWLDQ